jgi:hypothetical protein
VKISQVVHDQNLQLGTAGLVMLGEMARADQRQLFLLVGDNYNSLHLLQN